MQTLTFDTTVDEDREEVGELDDGILRTAHEARPDFRINDDGSVDLLAAKASVVVEGFGSDARVEP